MMADVVTQSRLFGASLRQPPRDVESRSHALLVQGGFVHQLAAGIFTLLPLGYRVHRKIENIIREEMSALGAQELLLPSLHPRALWEESGRFTTIDPPLFTVTDRHGRVYALAPTHEEVITDLARIYLQSYRQLPVAVFQLQTKFRNEQRPTGGLLRTREFMMKDLYSFHATENDLQSYYESVKQAYVRIFERCGLQTVPVEAESGSIGGAVSHEFALIAETGEDCVAQCPSCGFGAKVERLGETVQRCPKCSHTLEIKNCIESGHIFQLGQTYSKAMNASFTTEKGTKKVFTMGCYGIGVGRVLAAIVESSHDEKGIIWPASVAPFDVHVLPLKAGGNRQQAVGEAAERLVRTLADAGKRVLYDDREDASAGEKFADADLIGTPWRVVVSEKHIATQTVGLKKRADERERAVSAHDLLSVIGR